MFDPSQFCDDDSVPKKLIRAANNQNLEELKAALATAPETPLNSVKDSNDDTLLHIAVRKKNVQILEYLLGLDGIDLNSFNVLRKTPLLMAAIQPTSNILRLLIEKGADANLSDFEGNTPLHYAAYYNLVENCVLLLDNGANVNAQNNRGFTVLHVVCGVHSEVESLAMLMFYKADVSVPSWDENGLGYTPFELCLMHNKIEFQRFLLDYVIDGIGKMTILLGALAGAMEYHSNLFPILIDNVSEIIYDKGELTVFMNKIIYFKPEYLKMFIQKFEYVIRATRTVDNRITTSLYHYMNEHPLPQNHSNLTENLYAIFDGPFVFYFVDNINKTLNPNGISALIQIFQKHKWPLKPLSRLIFHLLSHGVDLTDAVVDQIYHCFGDGEVFRTILHMDIKKLYVYPSRAPLPAMIYDVEVPKLEAFFQKPILYQYTIFDKVMDYFASYQIKELCLSSVNKEELRDKVRKLPNVPLLLELARNAARNFIIERYEVKNSRQFYTILRVLPINNEYKAIISFQRKLYCLGR